MVEARVPKKREPTCEEEYDKEMIDTFTEAKKKESDKEMIDTFTEKTNLIKK